MGITNVTGMIGRWFLFALVFSAGILAGSYALAAEGGSGNASADTVIASADTVIARIIINLEEQKLYALDGEGYVVYCFPISSGRPGYGTPTGNYSVYNKQVVAHSHKYNATMTHWLAITADGAYGIHGLGGTSYYRHIGSPASHGCIRLRREDARELYPCVPIGTPVDIVRVQSVDLPFRESGSSSFLSDKKLIQETLEKLYGDSSL